MFVLIWIEFYDSSAQRLVLVWTWVHTSYVQNDLLGMIGLLCSIGVNADCHSWKWRGTSGACEGQAHRDVAGRWCSLWSVYSCSWELVSILGKEQCCNHWTEWRRCRSCKVCTGVGETLLPEPITKCRFVELNKLAQTIRLLGCSLERHVFLSSWKVTTSFCCGHSLRGQVPLLWLVMDLKEFWLSMFWKHQIFRVCVLVLLVTMIRVEHFSVDSFLEWVVHVVWVGRINRSFLNSLQNPTWWRDRATTSMHAWGLSLSRQGLTSFIKCNFPASPASWGVSICT